MGKFIGRSREIDVLRAKIDSNRSEFIAVYGRRRVGKTYLIRTAFDQKFTFQVTALGNATLQQQLSNFHIALRNTFRDPDISPPTNWLEAFQDLVQCLEKVADKRKVVFFDELPWFDTPKSGFLSAFEHFWNSWASGQTNILLIVCGSATSWILNKLINNRKGLHNRVTKRIKLEPFTLRECELFLKSKNISLDRYQIIQLYMVFGGIPFYWEEVEKGKSAARSINDICFQENGLLFYEFPNLFRSLFNDFQNHENIIHAIARKSKGISRKEIIEMAKLPLAGSSTRLLRELEESGFIQKYTPFGKKSRNSLYQLVDFYSLFFLKFIKDTGSANQGNWMAYIDSPAYRAWSGYAFELVCLSHIPQIKHALGISGVQTNVGSWRSLSREKGSQVDLVIDRKDQVINLCEMKFSINPFTIDKKYALELQDKIGIFKKETETRKSVFMTLITTFGLQKNNYSEGLVQNDLTMDILFREV
jgi:AAA+ ATPase superfamily predicted ATPase